MHAQALPPSPGALPQILLPHALAAQHYMSNTGPANGSLQAVTGPAHSSPTTETSNVSIGSYPTPASSHGEELPASPAASNGSQHPTLQQSLEYLPYSSLLVPGQIAQPPPPPALGCAGTPRKMAFPPQAGSPLPTPDERARVSHAVTRRRVSASVTPVELRVHEAAAAAAAAEDESDGEDSHEPLQAGFLSVASVAILASNR